MAELKYFGIEATEENINDTSARQIMYRPTIVDVIKDLQKETDLDEVEYRVKLLTTLCLKMAFSFDNCSSPSFSFQLEGNDYKNVVLLREKASGDKVVMEKVNARLQCVGVKVTKMRDSYATTFYIQMEEVKMNWIGSLILQ